KTLGRKSQPESVSCASSRGGGGGRGFRGAHDGRGGSGRGRLGVHPQQEVEEDELRNALDHEYMDQLIIEEEEKRLAREKEILERQDEKALQQAMEEKRFYQRQYKERERLKEQERQYDIDHDYFNPNNFTISEDEMDAAVADGLVQDQITDKVVVAEEGVAVSSSTQKSKGKKTAKEPALALPFRIYYKNRGSSERITKMQAKKFKIDDNIWIIS
nr:hypothetical protein [Tanacetum cinerariifolium]